MSKKVFLSVVLPMRNEADGLIIKLINIDKYFSSQKYAYEVLLVDKNSTDNTKEIARKASTIIKNLRIINIFENNEYLAIKTGMAEARGEWRLYMSAGSPAHVLGLDKIVSNLRNSYDIVTARRTGLPITIWAAEKFLNSLFKALFLTKKTNDVNSEIKCFSKKAAETIFPLAQTSGPALNLELMSLARRLGFRVNEIPIYWPENGTAAPSFVDYLRILCQTFKIRKRLLKFNKHE